MIPVEALVSHKTRNCIASLRRGAQKQHREVAIKLLIVNTSVTQGLATATENHPAENRRSEICRSQLGEN